MIHQQSLQENQPPQNYIVIENGVLINSQFNNYGVYTGNLIKVESVEKQLYLSFLIKALGSIRLESQNKKKVALLTLGDLEVSVQIIKNGEEFLFDEGLYRNYLVVEVSCGGLGSSLEIGRKEIKREEETKLIVTIQKNIEFSKTTKWILKDCVPVLQLGSTDPKKIIDCKIRQLSLSRNKPTLNSIQSPPSATRYLLYSGPLDTIPKTQIPDISSLTSYSSPPTKTSKLFLCHDMAGGYRQDINDYQPFPQQKNRYRASVEYYHTYRSFHLIQAEIFNYFSHYLITIPPMHWRRVCRKVGTKCLGTYIIEKNNPSQKQYLSDYTIKLLVYFCRKYRFDGYLINFEYPIKDVENLLLPWLDKLVKQLHTAVPGSQIIWYDSVINNGIVNYQNQLNQLNQIFYRRCDGIFLNYWWDEQKLMKSKSRAIEKKTIYVGNDCFGRGTFGGGQYNTYKAINTIHKLDGGSNILVPALFAMGFTYQNDKTNIQGWKINENCLYRGMNNIKLQLSHNQWMYTNKTINGYTWEINNQWAITSFKLCSRVYNKQIFALVGKEQINGNLVINFITIVAGTGPKFSDPYRVTMRARIGQTILNQSTTQMCQASQSQRMIQLKLQLDQDLITQQTILTIIEEGQDCQKWAGNYGSRFKNDCLHLTRYSRENDWMARIKTNFPNGATLPYITYYNMGHGYGFYLMGQKYKKAYDFLSDQDVNFVYVMNPPFQVSIQYHDAYIGGTCIHILGTTRVKLIQLDNNKQQQLTKLKQLECRVVVKNMEVGVDVKFKLVVKLGSQLQNVVIKEQNKLKNNWNQYIFSFSFQSSNLQGKLILYLQSNSSSCHYLLGQTAIYQPHNMSPQPKCNIQSLTISLSETNPPVAPLFFDICIALQRQCRILLKFGEEFVCFGWADEQNGYKIIIKNVHVSLQSKSNKVKIFILDGLMRFREVGEWGVDSRELWIKQKMQLI